jgi:hypothetical protein
MKIKFWAPLLVLIVVVGMIACEKKIGAPAGQNGLPKGCDTAKITYSSGTNTIKPIIDAQCGTGNSSCHASHGASGWDFSSYSSIQAQGQFTGGVTSPAYTSLFGGKPNQMPQTPQPGWSDSSSCMLYKLKQWILTGTPQ